MGLLHFGISPTLCIRSNTRQKKTECNSRWSQCCQQERRYTCRTCPARAVPSLTAPTTCSHLAHTAWQVFEKDLNGIEVFNTVEGPAGEPKLAEFPTRASAPKHKPSRQIRRMPPPIEFFTLAMPLPALMLRLCSLLLCSNFSSVGSRRPVR